MVTVEELVVKATPKGVDDVNDEMQKMEKSVDETTEKVDDQGSKLSGMARKFKGAMGAIIAGIAVGAAGVLSKVPSLGGVVDGLAAIFDALALQLDGELRPTLNKISTAFFDIARAIAKGDYDKAVKRLKELVKNLLDVEDLDAKTVIAKLQSIIADGLGELLGFITKTLNNIPQRDIEKALTSLIELIRFGITNGLKLLKEEVDWKALLSALLRFLGRAARASAPVIDKKIVQPLTKFIENNWRDWLDDAIKLAHGLIQTLIKGIKERMPIWKQRVKDYITKKAENILDDLVEDAKDYGTGLIDEMIKGIKQEKSKLIDEVETLMSDVRGYFPGSVAETGPLSNIDESGPGLVNTFAGGIRTQPSLQSTGGRTIDQRAGEAIDRTNRRTVVSIDGREVERATQSFRDNGTDLRGRYG
jgi:uncharacterized protein YoxC